MVHAISLFAVLYGIWLALSGHYTLLLLVAGAVCAALSVAVAIRMDLIDREGQPVHLTWRAPIYWVWLAVQVVVWSVHVCRHVLSPRLSIDPAVETVKATQPTDLGRVIYANSITLTPGTVSMRVTSDGIDVHALTKEAMEDLKTDEMDARITALESDKP